jgi:DNA mismatch repair protein MutS
MGKRLIRNWLDQPLLNPAFITRRLNAVDELYSNTVVRSEITEQLNGVYDLERLMTRIIYGSANGRELKSLSYTISKLPYIREIIAGSKSQMMVEIYNSIDPLEDIHTLIESAIVDEPPVTIREGGIIKNGYNAEVDELRSLMSDGKGFISKIEATERERTGIKNLKVGTSSGAGNRIRWRTRFGFSSPSVRSSRM